MDISLENQTINYTGKLIDIATDDKALGNGHDYSICGSTTSQLVYSEDDEEGDEAYRANVSLNDVVFQINFKAFGGDQMWTEAEVKAVLDTCPGS